MKDFGIDYSILVGGAAGQGIDTFASILEKTLKRCGYYVFTYRDYMSRVRGGHNFTQIRFSNKPVFTYTNKVDLIFPINKETIEIHSFRLKKGGVIVCDQEIAEGKNIINIPIKKILKEIQNLRVYNTVGLGAIIKYFGLPIHIPEKLILELFKGKKEIANINLLALRAGYKALDEKHKLESLEDNKIIINGNQALALGAIAAGCKFYCGYPMTPFTSILSYLAKKSNEMGIMVEQAEDELAALNMALGASYAGVRAMTGSSGGGIALMVESLSLAGIVELPVVLVNAQRAGPATGMATRTEQSDLRFVIHAGHGEFPRMVIALRSPEDAFYQTARAFNIADKYRIPVILLTDLYLADYTQTIEPFDFQRIKINRYIDDSCGGEAFKPYKLTENGISPRIIPGQIPGKVVLVDSHEHDEFGHITEDSELRVKMMDKRMKKLEGLREEVEEPWQIGDKEPENLIVCWGSTYGAVREVVERCNEEGISMGALIFGDIWPFPKEKLISLGKLTNKIIDVEQNKTAQLDSLIREETPYKPNHKILKYDGRPFSGDELYERIKEGVLK